MAGISKKRIKTKKGEVIRYTITYVDIFGKRHTSGYYETAKEAKKHLKEFETPKANDKIQYAYIFSSFLDKVKLKNANGTYITYEKYYNKYFKKFDLIEYSKVNSMYWQKFFDELEINVSPYVAQHCLKFAKAATNWQIRHGNLEYNVFNKIEPIKLPKANINHLLINETLQVLNECYKSFDFGDFACLFTFAGAAARAGEIIALEISDYNPVESSIKISKQFTRGQLFYHPKTEHSNRTIYIFETLNNVLKEQVKKLPPGTKLLFPNKNGGYRDVNNFRTRIFYPLLKLCGINKRVRLHDLRGSYTDTTQTAGLPVKFTQNQLGHAKAETTTNIYMRNNADMVAIAMEKLDMIFANVVPDFEKNQQKISKIENQQNSKIILFPKNRINKGI